LPNWRHRVISRSIVTSRVGDASNTTLPPTGRNQTQAPVLREPEKDTRGGCETGCGPTAPDRSRTRLSTSLQSPVSPPAVSIAGTSSIEDSPLVFSRLAPIWRPNLRRTRGVTFDYLLFFRPLSLPLRDLESLSGYRPTLGTSFLAKTGPGSDSPAAENILRDLLASGQVSRASFSKTFRYIESIYKTPICRERLAL